MLTGHIENAVKSLKLECWPGLWPRYSFHL